MALPVERVQAAKSLTEPGSVASTSMSSPAGTVFTNTIEATGTGPTGGVVTATDSATYTSFATSLDVIKTNDATAPLFPGDQVTYTITVENTGNVDLTNVVLDDSFADAGASYLSGDTDIDGVLDTDEIWTYSAQYTVTQDDLNSGADLINSERTLVSRTITSSAAAVRASVRAPGFPDQRRPAPQTPRGKPPGAVDAPAGPPWVRMSAWPRTRRNRPSQAMKTSASSVLIAACIVLRLNHGTFRNPYRSMLNTTPNWAPTSGE